MVRIGLYEILLFFVPFVVYAAWLLLRRQAVGSGEVWRAAPLGWLAIAGLLVVAAGLFFLSNVEEGPSGSRYVPTHLDKGRLVPGHFER